MQRQNELALWSEKWPAPAKINLMLRIVGRRPDGYHLLQTVFQFTDLCDWLTFHPQADGKVGLLRTTPGVAEADDLTIRAANLLKSATGCGLGVCIELEKNLPMGGGLGGGSSDAATTLVVLNHLWGLGLSVAQLMELGLGLGADVPVFVYGQSAWAEGVGEKLQKIDVPEAWVLIVRPDCHVNTGQIFADKNLTRDSKSITIADFTAGQHTNDCTRVVIDRYQLIKDAIEDLSEYAEARLTGTGSCVFALFDGKNEAEAALSGLCVKWQVYLARAISQSPLYTKLAAVH